MSSSWVDDGKKSGAQLSRERDHQRIEDYKRDNERPCKKCGRSIFFCKTWTGAGPLPFDITVKPGKEILEIVGGEVEAFPLARRHRCQVTVACADGNHDQCPGTVVQFGSKPREEAPCTCIHHDSGGE